MVSIITSGNIAEDVDLAIDNLVQTGPTEFSVCWETVQGYLTSGSMVLEII